MSAGSPQRIAILGKAIAPQAMAMAQEAGVEVITTDAYLNAEELEAFVSRHQPDGIILRLGRIHDAAMAAAPGLKIIAKHGVGFDTIDLDAATARGITVSVATGANAISVAEHALALIFGVARGIAYLDRRMREGHWDKADVLGTELCGKTLGIVGIGAIGLHLAKICRGLGMDIRVFDPAPVSAADQEFARVASVDDLLQECDVVSLHCPLTPATRNLISEPQFKQMKLGAILINTARGGLIDLDALVDALETGRIAGAGLDTFPEEPPTLADDLRRQGRLVISPHVGASTREAGVRVGTLVMQQVLDCIAGREIDSRYVVNPVAAQSPLAATS
ncbi:hydroxyacid dehydrogenase [Altererythrobacter sp. Z27]|uniref:hydroxyacid dehydrogenase n=1 Tax=Altererythrobacter sp. Z27 TaxID=3461147 RepID=UPI0040443970